MRHVARWLPPPALGLACLLDTATALAADGLLATKSPHPARETMDRFEEAARQRGPMVFARIDHAAGAERVGKMLRPTEVLILGNPQGGTPFMECAQSVGIDLPLKRWSGQARRARPGSPATTRAGG